MFSLLSQALVSRPDKEIFWVLLALCLLPLYVRASFSALLRKVKKRLSGSRKSTEGQEPPADAKHLSMRPTSHPLPWIQHHWARGRMEPSQAMPQAGPSVQPVLSSSCNHSRSPFLADWTMPWWWGWPAFPQRGCMPRGEAPLLCTELQGCLARLRGVFLNFSQLLQNLNVVGQYFGMCWALLSVSGRDCSDLDLPWNYCFLFMSG